MPERAIANLIIQRATEAVDEGDIVARALEVIRKHLGMDVAYVSEFVDDRSVFRKVDAPGLDALIKVGDSQSLDDVYCRHILAGRLPELIPDTSANAFARELPITQAIPIGAHLSVPIRLPDGTCYGMFCCLSFASDQTLNERDHRMVRAFAELAAFEIGRDVEARREEQEKRARIEAVLEGSLFDMVYQPVVDIHNMRTVGFEALCRVRAEPIRSPDQWFAEADEVQRREAFELAAIRSATSHLSALPDGAFLAVNISPATVLMPELEVALKDLPHDRIVLEITEQILIANYDAIRAALAPLRALGVRVAIDDAGAGHSSLRHIFQLEPDLIKFDMSLTRGINADPVRRAMIDALVGFAQGYHLGRPAPLEPS
ncbi:EAL domain-containing protein [Amorphus sp. 3PC139-8]|uniref:sensor domain-containing phosphodiesterase n=1 Tax=Amorphus sp. 3PC139-8 TaxID=2735676 RepID=UPI00345DF896